ncbi:MAG: hypothetical protein KatS3mg113_0066 [Planctomycetaceae bacterium]|nr:MAG: hypothetical protein KatS3mg113_0066 [Planctomycetaceae bacterium]
MLGLLTATRVRWILWVIGACCWIAGCGPVEPPKPELKEPEPQSESERPPSLDEMMAEPGPPPRPLLGDPVGRVRSALQHLANGRWSDAYDYFPLSYQRELDQTIQRLAGRFDAPLWSRGFTVLRKSSEVLAKHRDQLLPALMALGEEPITPEAQQRISHNWQSLMLVMTRLLDSGWDRLERLQQFSVKEFLAEHGGSLSMLLATADPSALERLQQLAAADIKVLQHQGDRATLRFTLPMQAESYDVPFVYVEGRWIQQHWADAWKRLLAGLSEKIEPWTEDQGQQLRDRLQQQLQELEQLLDQMLAAEQPEQLQPLILPALLQWRMIWETLTAPPQTATSARITVNIMAHLSPEEQTWWLHRLQQLTDRPEEALYTLYPTREGYAVHLQPVADIERFAQRIDFAITQQLDVSARQLQLLPRQP